LNNRYGLLWTIARQPILARHWQSWRPSTARG
jgi:hypothetical protein